jgi:hypothetical protein
MRKFVLAAVLVLMASGAQAATLNVVGGQLMGASDVLVDGSLYDVQFLDGTCIDLYNGCDEASDFTFQTFAASLLASQALLDQVFLDGVSGLFDSVPNLTAGCNTGLEPENVTECSAFTPSPVYGLSGPSSIVKAVNRSPSNISAFPCTGDFGFPATVGDCVAGDSVGNPSTFHTFPGSGLSYSARVYAIWSPIPEPNTALLLSLGLVGLSARHRASLPGP